MKRETAGPPKKALGELFSSYFQNLFSSIGSEGLQELLEVVQTRVTNEMNNTLIALSSQMKWTLLSPRHSLSRHRVRMALGYAFINSIGQQ
jgi:hypothetical protein